MTRPLPRQARARMTKKLPLLEGTGFEPLVPSLTESLSPGQSEKVAFREHHCCGD